MSNYLVYTEGGYFAWESHISDLKEFVQNSLISTENGRHPVAMLRFLKTRNTCSYRDK